jgi:acyl-CoA ligase (AMP-forming) (exosortase A-associated)
MDYLIHHLLRTSAAHQPEKEALVYREQRLSYADVERAAKSLAVGLSKAGLRRGDRIGIWLESSIAQALSIFAASYANAAFVPINHLLYPQQVAHIIHDCRMKGLITTMPRLNSVIDLLADLQDEIFAVVPDAGESPHSRIKTFAFDHLCQEDGAKQKDQCIGRDLAIILYTSGSTGKPKGVMLTHDQVLAGAAIVSEYLEITEDERILALLPFSFDAGLNQLMTAFCEGATLVMMNFVFAREIVQVLANERITGLAGVPTLWSLLAQPQSGLYKARLPFLRYITSTGGKLPRNVLYTLQKVLPSTKIFLMYGLTEAFRSTYLPPDELDRHPTSIGKAIPNTEIFLINDQGERCKPGEIGELIHRGPTVALGYWGHPDLTARVFRRNPFSIPEMTEGETVCYSGDLATMDEEGFLYIVGRRDAMIKSSGFRISPTEVEEIIFQSGRVRNAAVIGVPDKMLGQSIKAFVVAKDSETHNPAAIIDFCAANLPRHMVPKSLEYLLELPLTSSGKVDYPALRRREGIA